jgi:hypothetical protein
MIASAAYLFGLQHVKNIFYMEGTYMKSFKSSASLICAVLLASGCASYNHEAAIAKANRGDCNGADNELDKGVGAGDSRAISSKGWLYEYCYKNRGVAIDYYRLAARKGDDWARSQLVRLGQPIPSADLTDDDNVRVRVRQQ